MKNPELKPCPFCGNDAVYHETDVKPGYQSSVVSCKKCTAIVGKCDLTAAECWNRRVDDQTTVEQLASSVFGDNDKQSFLLTDDEVD